MLKDKTTKNQESLNGDDTWLQDSITLPEAATAGPKNGIFLSREEELTLIKDIQGRYQSLLNDLSNAPEIINSLVHMVECLEKHQLSLSVYMDRGTRTPQALERDFVTLSQKAGLLQESWNKSLDNLSKHNNLYIKDNSKECDSLDSLRALEVETKDLFNQFKFTTAVVDCVAPHYVRQAHIAPEAVNMVRKVGEQFEAVIPLRDFLFSHQEGILNTSVSRKAPYMAMGIDGGSRFDDLMQEARQSLTIALHRFDPSRGLRFSTFAVPWVGAAVYSEMYQNSSMIHVPFGMQKTIYKMDREGQSLDDLADTNPNFVEIMSQARKALAVVSTEEILDSGESGRTVNDILFEQIDVTFQSDIAVIADYRKEVMEVINSSLNPRDGDILLSRFGLNGCEPQGLKALSVKHGICVERVRQIEQEALRKVKELLPGFESKVFLD